MPEADKGGERKISCFSACACERGGGMTNKEEFNGLINQLTDRESMQVFEMLMRILSRTPEERAEMGKEAAEVVNKLTDEECEYLLETYKEARRSR